MSDTTATTITIPAGTISSNQSYNSYDRVLVSGTLNDTTLSEGAGGGRGVITVINGGSISNITATGQAEITVENGGMATNTTLSGFGADMVVSSGATVRQITASNSAGITVEGGILSNVTLAESASLTVGSGATVADVNAGKNTQVDVDAGGRVSSISVSEGGYIDNTGGTITSATIRNGGSAFLDQNGTMSGATIENGGELQINNGTATNVALKTGGRINFIALAYDSSAGYNYDPKTYTLTVTTSNGSASVTLDPKNSDIQPGQQFILSDEDGSEVIETCFLAGSMIQTPTGDVPIENIRLGDNIITYVTGQTETRSIIWAGKTHATVRRALPDDEAGYPVRILKNAIADGVPYKDMLITAEHCLFFDGRFVPVRMLVNGVSIFYDKSITSYDYYHIETEQHSIVRADGMLTESYLDTGNRRSFQQEGSVITLGGKICTWENDAGAPLCVDRSFVEPLFHKIEYRENSVIGCQIPEFTAEQTNDPNLHLITQTGAIIRPMRQNQLQYSFMLPPDTKAVRIMSRTDRPADVIGPFVNDRRYMGVAVADVRLLCDRHEYDITAHLQAEKPEGWHATDWTDCAWTNGNAVLPLGNYLTRGKMGILSMTVRAAGPYLIHDRNAEETKLRSA